MKNQHAQTIDTLTQFIEKELEDNFPDISDQESAKRWNALSLILESSQRDPEKAIKALKYFYSTLTK